MRNSIALWYFWIHKTFTRAFFLTTSYRKDEIYKLVFGNILSIISMFIYFHIDLNCFDSLVSQPFMWLYFFVLRFHDESEAYTTFSIFTDWMSWKRGFFYSTNVRLFYPVNIKLRLSFSFCFHNVYETHIMSLCVCVWKIYPKRQFHQSFSHLLFGIMGEKYRIDDWNFSLAQHTYF